MRIDPATETVDVCILCDTHNIVADGWFAKRLGLLPPYGVVRCTHCGLRWLSPRPTAKAYKDLYTDENYFRPEGKDTIDPYASVAEIRRPYFRARLATVARYYPGKSFRILDIGAATGEFLDEARRLGHHIQGIELSESARHTANTTLGIELSGIELHKLPEEEQYDVIHMNHVFEHLPDPTMALVACHRLLRTDGLLLIEVPQQINNDLDRLKMLLHLATRPMLSAYSLHHTFFFTPTTLTRLLERHGFEVRYLATSNPARTPLKPFRLINLLLKIFLWLSDRSHRGGNIIEIHAFKCARPNANAGR